MTRFFALSLAVLALAFSACEKHPIAGQEIVTHTHGSNGAESAEHGEKADAKHEAKHEEKKVEAAPAGAKEESPKFFPEKK